MAKSIKKLKREIEEFEWILKQKQTKFKYRQVLRKAIAKRLAEIKKRDNGRH